VILALVVVSGCTPADSGATEDSPEAAAAAFTRAMQSHDWDRLSSLMHSDALSEFREMLRPVIQMQEAGDFRRALFGNVELETIQGLSDAEFFAGFMGAMFSQTPMIAEVLEGAEMKIIGRIMEGKTAHVVARLEMSVDEIDISKIEVMSFREEAGGWRAMLTGDVSSVAAAIAASAEGVSGQGR
jgi:hypothetical protein